MTSRSQFWSASTCRLPSTPSTTTSCSGVCSQEFGTCDSDIANVYPLYTSKAGPIMSSLGSTNQQPSGSMWASPRGPFLVPCCLRYTVAQWLMLLRATASNIASMLTTPSYVLPCTSTTSDRLAVLAQCTADVRHRQYSCMLSAQPSYQCLLPESVYQ